VTRDEVAVIVRMVDAGWSGRRLEPDAAMVYMEGLSDLPFDVTLDAMRNLIRTEDFRPTVSEIRREVADLEGLLPPDLDVALAQAEALARWREQQAYSNGLTAGSVCPTAHDVVVRVWASLSVSVDDPTWKHLFRAAYREAKAGSERATLSAPMLSIERGA
jgi:hypothetical protein